ISDLDTQIAEQRAIAKQLQEDIANQVSLRDQFLRTGALPGKKDLYEDRVRLVLSEAVPDQLAFPKLVIILPAGAVLVCGLVTAGIVVRALVDQRFRGPADLAMLPRARIIGMVPLGSLDPAGRTAVETAFRDRPTGVIAEHFRQIRAPLIKRMEQA